MREYPNLVMTDDFMFSFAERTISAADRRAIARTLGLLNESDTHPSLRIHLLHGDKEGTWSASASLTLRIEFERWPDGRKMLVRCSRHYDK